MYSGTCQSAARSYPSAPKNTFKAGILEYSCKQDMGIFIHDSNVDTA